VHEPELRDVVEGVRDLHRDPKRVLLGERPVAPDAFVERLPVHVLHSEVVRPLRLADAVPGDDVVVVHHRRRADLAEEPLHVVDVLGEPSVEDLQSDDPSGGILLGLVDPPHASDPQGGENPKAVDLLHCVVRPRLRHFEPPFAGPAPSRGPGQVGYRS